MHIHTAVVGREFASEHGVDEPLTGNHATGFSQQHFEKIEFHRGQVQNTAITFGDASTSQLKEITELTKGLIFDGKTDLAGAFRKVKGYT